ncbi:MAG: hypothetical protein IPH62_07085 [Ignavibacteriae bacterium]|nr:hypothetical protein [Ignavibacteriota bacterium]
MNISNHLFLKAAKSVLEEYKSSLNAEDIYNTASEKKLLNSKGKTPVNTMRARLAEEIRTNGVNSIFIRVGPNKFGLRVWIDNDNIHEYKTRSFLDSQKDETLITIPREKFGSLLNTFGFNSNFKRSIKIVDNKNNWEIIKRSEADRKLNLKQIVTYVILKNFEDKYLVFKRGHYTKLRGQLANLLCIGFGGHLEIKDENLFENIIISCARREINEELKSIYINNLKIIGIINDESSTLGIKHIAFVMTGELPQNFDVKNWSTEKSINKLELVTEKELWKNFHELEFWSMLVARKLIKIPRGTESIIINLQKKITKNVPLIIVGSISSGKSEICKYLHDIYNIAIISSSKLISELLNLPTFDEADRENFQDKTDSFVKSIKGLNEFVNAIYFETNKFKDRIFIVEGLRNITVYEKLVKKIGKHTLLYIDTPKDKGFEFFKNRLGFNTTVEEYRKRLEHNVEKEVKMFKRKADVIIFNGGSKNSLFKAIDNWWKLNVEI